MKSDRKPTSIDVAFHANVSQSTVSRALRGHGGISVETRERIERVASELGYLADRRASNLRMNCTRCIAVVMLTGDAGNPTNPFYFDLLTAVEAAAAARGFQTIVSGQTAAGVLRADFEDRGEADGLIVIGSAAFGPAWRFFTQAFEGGRNVVAWGAPDNGLPVVRSDGEEGAGLAIDHLVALGRRRIAFVGPGWQEQFAYRARRDGYIAAMARHGLAPVEVAGSTIGDRVAQGVAAGEELLASGRPIDGVFAASDALAIGVVNAFRSAGVDVPGDVAVIGFDGGYVARHTHPALTSIEQDAAAAGAALVEAVLSTDPDRAASAGLVPVRLALRASA